MVTPLLIALAIGLCVVCYVVGSKAASRRLSYFVKDVGHLPDRGPNADKSYQVIRINGDDHYFTTEQLNLARARAIKIEEAEEQWDCKG